MLPFAQVNEAPRSLQGRVGVFTRGKHSQCLPRLVLAPRFRGGGPYPSLLLIPENYNPRWFGALRERPKKIRNPLLGRAADLWCRQKRCLSASGMLQSPTENVLASIKAAVSKGPGGSFRALRPWPGTGNRPGLGHGKPGRPASRLGFSFYVASKSKSVWQYPGNPVGGFSRISLLGGPFQSTTPILYHLASFKSKDESRLFLPTPGLFTASIMIPPRYTQVGQTRTNSDKLGQTRTMNGRQDM